MSGVPYHRVFRWICGTQSKQCRELDERGVDRGVVEAPTGFGSRNDRTAARAYRARGRRLDRLPRDAATDRTAEAGRSRHSSGRSGAMKGRASLLFLILSLASSFSACRKKTVEVKMDPLLEAYDVEFDSSDPQRHIPLNYQQA